MHRFPQKAHKIAAIVRPETASIESVFLSYNALIFQKDGLVIGCHELNELVNISQEVILSCDIAIHPIFLCCIFITPQYAWWASPFNLLKLSLPLNDIVCSQLTDPRISSSCGCIWLANDLVLLWTHQYARILQIPESMLISCHNSISVNSPAIIEKWNVWGHFFGAAACDKGGYIAFIIPGNEIVIYAPTSFYELGKETSWNEMSILAHRFSTIPLSPFFTRLKIGTEIWAVFFLHEANSSFLGVTKVFSSASYNKYSPSNYNRLPVLSKSTSLLSFTTEFYRVMSYPIKVKVDGNLPSSTSNDEYPKATHPSALLLRTAFHYWGSSPGIYIPSNINHYFPSFPKRNSTFLQLTNTSPPKASNSTGYNIEPHNSETLILFRARSVENFDSAKLLADFSKESFPSIFPHSVLIYIIPLWEPIISEGNSNNEEGDVANILKNCSTSLKISQQSIIHEYIILAHWSCGSSAILRLTKTEDNKKGRKWVLHCFLSSGSSVSTCSLSSSEFSPLRDTKEITNYSKNDLLNSTSMKLCQWPSFSISGIIVLRADGMWWLYLYHNLSENSMMTFLPSSITESTFTNLPGNGCLVSVGWLSLSQHTPKPLCDDFFFTLQTFYSIVEDNRLGCVIEIHGFSISGSRQKDEKMKLFTVKIMAPLLHTEEVSIAPVCAWETASILVRDEMIVSFCSENISRSSSPNHSNEEISFIQTKNDNEIFVFLNHSRYDKFSSFSTYHRPVQLIINPYSSISSLVENNPLRNSHFSDSSDPNVNSLSRKSYPGLNNGIVTSMNASIGADGILRVMICWFWTDSTVEIFHTCEEKRNLVISEAVSLHYWDVTKPQESLNETVMWFFGASCGCFVGDHFVIGARNFGCSGLWITKPITTYNQFVSHLNRTCWCHLLPWYLSSSIPSNSTFESFWREKIVSNESIISVAKISMTKFLRRKNNNNKLPDYYESTSIHCPFEAMILYATSNRHLYLLPVNNISAISISEGYPIHFPFRPDTIRSLLYGEYYSMAFHLLGKLSSILTQYMTILDDLSHSLTDYLIFEWLWGDFLTYNLEEIVSLNSVLTNNTIYQYNSLRHSPTCLENSLATSTLRVWNHLMDYKQKINQYDHQCYELPTLDQLPRRKEDLFSVSLMPDSTVTVLEGLLKRLSVNSLDVIFDNPTKKQLMTIIRILLEKRNEFDSLDRPGRRVLLEWYEIQQPNEMSEGNLQKKFKSLSFVGIFWACMSNSTRELAKLMGLLDISTSSILDIWGDFIVPSGVVLWMKMWRDLLPILEFVGKFIIHGLKKDGETAADTIRHCALFYILSQKVSSLISLCRVYQCVSLQKFFSFDFSLERSKKAASVNAYAALGKGNILFSAACFILANQPRMAAQVITDRLGEWELGWVILRLTTFDSMDDLEWYCIFLLDSLDRSCEKNDLSSPLRVIELKTSREKLPVKNPWIFIILYWVSGDVKQALRLLIKVFLGFSVRSDDVNNSINTDLAGLSMNSNWSLFLPDGGEETIHILRYASSLLTLKNSTPNLIDTSLEIVALLNSARFFRSKGDIICSHQMYLELLNKLLLFMNSSVMNRLLGEKYQLDDIHTQERVFPPKSGNILTNFSEEAKKHEVPSKSITASVASGLLAFMSDESTSSSSSSLDPNESAERMDIAKDSTFCLSVERELNDKTTLIPITDAMIAQLFREISCYAFSPYEINSKDNCFSCNRNKIDVETMSGKENSSTHPYHGIVEKQCNKDVDTHPNCDNYSENDLISISDRSSLLKLYKLLFNNLLVLHNILTFSGQFIEGVVIFSDNQFSVKVMDANSMEISLRMVLITFHEICLHLASSQILCDIKIFHLFELLITWLLFLTFTVAVLPLQDIPWLETLDQSVFFLFQLTQVGSATEKITGISFLKSLPVQFLRHIWTKNYILRETGKSIESHTFMQRTVILWWHIWKALCIWFRNDSHTAFENEIKECLYSYGHKDDDIFPSNEFLAFINEITNSFFENTEHSMVSDFHWLHFIYSIIYWVRIKLQHAFRTWKNTQYLSIKLKSNSLFFREENPQRLIFWSDRIYTLHLIKTIFLKDAASYFSNRGEISLARTVMYSKSCSDRYRVYQIENSSYVPRRPPKVLYELSHTDFVLAVDRYSLGEIFALFPNGEHTTIFCSPEQLIDSQMPFMNPERILSMELWGTCLENIHSSTDRSEAQTLTTKPSDIPTGVIEHPFLPYRIFYSLNNTFLSVRQLDNALIHSWNLPLKIQTNPVFSSCGLYLTVGCVRGHLVTWTWSSILSRLTPDISYQFLAMPLIDCILYTTFHNMLAVLGRFPASYRRSRCNLSVEDQETKYSEPSELFPPLHQEETTILVNRHNRTASVLRLYLFYSMSFHLFTACSLPIRASQGIWMSRYHCILIGDGEEWCIYCCDRKKLLPCLFIITSKKSLPPEFTNMEVEESVTRFRFLSNVSWKSSDFESSTEKNSISSDIKHFKNVKKWRETHSYSLVRTVASYCPLLDCIAFGSDEGELFLCKGSSLILKGGMDEYSVPHFLVRNDMAEATEFSSHSSLESFLSFQISRYPIKSLTFVPTGILYGCSDGTVGIFFLK